MAERSKLPNGTRFEVFKRDKFTCQYCGAKAPEVVLNVDHIRPVADGGTDDLMNLATSCWTCNNGKSDRKLDDASAVVVAREQAEQVEERRQQVRMMADWQIELARLNPEMDAIRDAFVHITDRTLTPSGERDLRNLTRRFGMQAVISAIAVAFDSYPAEYAFGKIGGICFNRKREHEDPVGGQVARVISYLDAFLFDRGMWRRECQPLLRRILDARIADPEQIKRYIAERRSEFPSYGNVADLLMWVDKNGALP